MRTLVRQGATVAVASAVALVGLSAPAIAAPGVPVGPADAGKVIAWGTPGAETSTTIPDSLVGTKLTAIDAGANYNLALDADGNVAVWGSSLALPKATFPEGGISGAKAIAAANENALALKSDGSIVAWGSPTTGINDVPADLGAAKAVHVNAWTGMAILADGSVRQWGQSASFNPLPPGLSDVVDIASGTLHSLALKSDGTVVAWGMIPTAPEATVPDFGEHRVVAIAAGVNESAAVTDDGKVHLWGSDTYGPAPAELANEQVVDIDMDSSVVVRTASGKVFAWGRTTDPNSAALSAVPASLAGEKATAVSAGVNHNAVLVATISATGKPVISGTPKAGQTLTASDATFSLEPDAVTTQWKANGTAIAGATSKTFTLTNAQVGKKITVTQTATKGDDSVSVTSDATSSVVAAQAPSTVRATAAAARYGTAPRVTVTLAPSSATGRVDVYKGATRLGAANASQGRAVVTLSRTALKPGAHVLSVRYAGNAATAASSTSVRLVVVKASASVKASVATKKVVAQRTKAKVKVTVRATGVVPSGQVAIYQGSRKVGVATLNKRGDAVVKLKKLTKAGKVKLSVRYRGSSTVNAATKTIKVKVRKR